MLETVQAMRPSIMNMLNNQLSPYHQDERYPFGWRFCYDDRV